MIGDNLINYVFLKGFLGKEQIQEVPHQIMPGSQNSF